METRSNLKFLTTHWRLDILKSCYSLQLSRTAINLIGPSLPYVSDMITMQVFTSKRSIYYRSKCSEFNKIVYICLYLHICRSNFQYIKFAPLTNNDSFSGKTVEGRVYQNSLRMWPVERGECMTRKITVTFKDVYLTMPHPRWTSKNNYFKVAALKPLLEQKKEINYPSSLPFQPS